MLYASTFIFQPKESDYMQKKIKVGTSSIDVLKKMWSSIPQLLLFSFIYTILVNGIFKPAIKLVFALFMRLKGYKILLNSDITSFFWSITGIVVGMLILILVSILIYFEFATILNILKLGEQKTKSRFLFSLEKSWLSLKNLISPGTIGFILYSIVLLPLFSFGVHPKILPDMTIPNFVIGEVEKHTGGTIFLIILLILGVLLSVRLLLVFPLMVFEGKTFFKAARKSFEKTKNNSIRILSLILIISLVSTIVIAVPAFLFVKIRGILLMPLKALSFLLAIVASAIVPSAIICVSLVCYENFVPEFTVKRDRKLVELDDRIKEFYSNLKIKVRAFFDKFAPKWLHKRPYLLLIFLIIPLLIIVDIVIPIQLEHSPPLIIGHRGSLDGVENTKEAVIGAINQGADYAEIDILLSKDGVPMVIHDTNLSRLSGEKKFVYNLTAEELKEIPLNDRGFTGNISTLDEICKVSKGKINLMIEIKTHGRETISVVEETAEVVRQNHMQSHVVYQTTNLNILNEFHIKFPMAKVGYVIFSYFGSFSPKKIINLGADFLAVEQGLLTTSLAETCDKIGMPLYVWTVNSPDSLEYFYDYGINGIITDYPADIKNGLAAIEKQNSEAFISTALIDAENTIFGKNSFVSYLLHIYHK